MPTATGHAASSDRDRLRGSLRRFAEESARLTAVFGDAHDLYTRDLSALAAIAEAAEADRPLGPARLADALHLSPPATTALIDRLERARHIARRADPRDRRRTILELQPRALRVASAFFEPLNIALGEVMDRYTAEQLAVIAGFLNEAVLATGEVADAVGAEPASSETEHLSPSDHQGHAT